MWASASVLDSCDWICPLNLSAHLVAWLCIITLQEEIIGCQLSSLTYISIYSWMKMNVEKIIIFPSYHSHFLQCLSSQQKTVMLWKLGQIDTCNASFPRPELLPTWIIPSAFLCNPTNLLYSLSNFQ